MKTLNALLTREARAQRGLVAVAALLAPALVLFIQRSGTVDPLQRDQVTLLQIIPGALIIVMLALTVDAFTRDFESDIGETLSRLPVQASKLVLAKCLWLAALTLALGAWVLLVEAAGGFLTGGAPSLNPTSSHHWQPGKAAWLLALLGGMTVLLSVWVRRPFVTCCAAVACTLGAVAGLNAKNETLLRTPEVFPVHLALVLLIGGMLIAAVRSFLPGHLLPFERAQRIASGLIVLVPLTGAMALAQWAGAPGKRAGTIGEMPALEGQASPDGRRAVVFGSHTYRALVGHTAEEIYPWVLDVPSGEVVARVPPSHWPDQLNGFWHSDGRLRLMAWDDGSIAHWDPNTGVLEPTGMHITRDREEHRGVRRRKGAWEVRISGAWATPQWRISASPLLSSVPGRAYQRITDGTIVRYDLEAGTQVEFTAHTSPRPRAGHGLRESPGGDVLCVQGLPGDPVVYLDANTGAVLAELDQGWVHGGWTGGGDPIAFAKELSPHLEGTRDYLLLGPKGLRARTAPRFHALSSIGNGRFLAFDRTSIWEVDRDVARMRLIYTPKD